jgi:hypothetical protein
MDLKMIRGNFNGVMVLFIKGILLKIILMGKVFIFGVIKGNMKVIGLIIKWKGMVFLIGLMEEFLKVSTKMIKKMVMENLNGKMVGNIMVNGKMGNKMVKGSSIILNKMCGEKVFGKKGKGFHGLMKKKNLEKFY